MRWVAVLRLFVAIATFEICCEAGREAQAWQLRPLSEEEKPALQATPSDEPPLLTPPAAPPDNDAPDAAADTFPTTPPEPPPIPAPVAEEAKPIDRNNDASEFAAPQLLVFRPGDRITVTAVGPSRLMFLGGAGIDGPRYIWWNFVSSSQERIEQAKADWKAGRFKPVPGETEFIPLPDR